MQHQCNMPALTHTPHREKLGPHWIEFPKENPPDWILRGPGRDDVPDVMLNRDRAFIITVKASEINESTDTGKSP